MPSSRIRGMSWMLGTTLGCHAVNTRAVPGVCWKTQLLSRRCPHDKDLWMGDAWQVRGSHIILDTCGEGQKRVMLLSLR